MREMLFGFEGTMGRLEFFLGHVILFFIMFVLAVLLLIPFALTGNVYTPQPGSSQPGLALFTFSLGLFFMWSSCAMISKRLGWKGGKGNVSWVYFLTAAGGLVIGAVSTAVGVVSLYSIVFWLVNFGAFIIACIIPGKVQGEDFDENSLAAKVDAEMRQRYGQPSSDQVPVQQANVPAMPSAPPAVRANRPTSFGRR